MQLRRAAVLLAPLAALLLAAGPSTAAPPGFAFLEVPAGARQSALGGAWAAMSAGVEAAFWNPAGLSEVKGTEITASHFEYIQSLKHDQFAMAGELFGGGLAGSIRAMYSQPIEERDDVGNLIGTFGSHDLEFQLGYGRHVGTASVGGGLQLVRERIANEEAMTWSGSVGGLWHPAACPSVRLGAMAQHMGPAAHYTIDGVVGDPVGLPAALQAGAAVHHKLARGLSLDPELDVRMTRGRQAVVALGGELASDVGAALRFGVREGDDLSNVSAGVGWHFGLCRVDYAWVPSKLDLGDTHRFSFGAQF